MKIKFLGYANETNGIKVGMNLGGELAVYCEGKNIVIFDKEKAKDLYTQMNMYYKSIMSSC